MIIIKNYRKSYTKFEMVIPELILKGNSIYALIGKNGAGKTTLLNSITEQINYQGTISFDGLSIKDNREDVLGSLGYVGDQLYFTQNMKVKDFIKFTQTFYKNWDHLLCSRLLETFKLNQYSDKKLKELSRGNLMKANIIICLSRKPKYIILDEPTSGLDIAIREEVLDAILKFKNENTTIIFSTHIIEDIEDIASHILLINNGELILNETKEKVISDHNDLDLKKIILNCNIKLN